MSIKRIAETVLREILPGDKVGVVLGARQVGKTTLVVKLGESIRAFEIKWSSRRGAGKAFQTAYGVPVESIRPDLPFVSGTLQPTAPR